MNISPINSNNTNFKGKVIIKGTWTQELKDAILNNAEVKQLAAGKKDIIAHMKSKRAPKKDMWHYPKQPLYSLSLMSRSEEPSFWEKVKTFFNVLPKINVTRAYHSETGMLSIINQRIKAKRYQNIL